MNELQCLPYGIGRADEGVCILARLGPYRILLDCGLEDISPLLADAKRTPPADIVLCSHAHPDHAKGLLALHEAFPQMPIYASEVTTQLLPLNWLSETGELPPHPAFCHALPWRAPVEFREGLSAELYPAGHLPGAAAFLLTYTTARRSYTLFYTGDCLLSNSRLVEGLPLEELRGLKPDVLLIEGSYGTARHPHRRQQENRLADRINQAIADQRSIVLPAPTLGLGQELLMLLRSHHQFTGRSIDIWVDGAIALGCDIYVELLSHFPNAVQNFARHQPLFWDERVRPRVRRLPGDVESTINAAMQQAPCIVITDQIERLNQYLQPGRWLILLPQTLGHTGTTETQIYEHIQTDPALQQQVQSGQLTIDTYLLGDHCDGAGTTQLIHNLRPQHIVFFHGEPTYLADLTGLEELQNRYQIHIPSAGTLVDLPVGETFLQPSAPDAKYEGEATELDSDVLIRLPNSITADRRWQAFADTGLVEARWQGDDLVLRGVTQRELLSQTTSAAIPSMLQCCEHCVHYRGQRCWNSVSPLYGFRVTPEGYCPAFEQAPLLTNEDA